MPDSEETVETGDGRTRRWDEHKQERRLRILEAAVALFSERGREAGVKDIAERARLPRSVVYRIFKDRDDLDEQVREFIVADLMSALTPTLVPHGTIRDAIRDSVESYVGWLEKNQTLHLFLGAGSTSRPTAGSHVVVSARTSIGSDVANYLYQFLSAKGADPRFAQPLAFALIGTVDATVNRWLSQSQPRISPTELAEFLQISLWSLIEAHCRILGIDIDPDMTIDNLDLVGDPPTAH
ncbi:TetR/AcrR family transcriptional regulator [Williamsia sterculiae]|nr:TetR/AcrR family transcriptional regulator [Williamsia sterculiae]